MIFSSLGKAGTNPASGQCASWIQRSLGKIVHNNLFFCPLTMIPLNQSLLSTCTVFSVSFLLVYLLLLCV